MNVNIFDLIIFSAVYTITPVNPDVDGARFEKVNAEYVDNALSCFYYDQHEISVAIYMWENSTCDPAYRPTAALKCQSAYIRWATDCWQTFRAGQAELDTNTRHARYAELWYLLGDDYDKGKLPPPIRRNKGGMLIFPWEDH